MANAGASIGWVSSSRPACWWALAAVGLTIPGRLAALVIFTPRAGSLCRLDTMPQGRFAGRYAGGADHGHCSCRADRMESCSAESSSLVVQDVLGAFGSPPKYRLAMRLLGTRARGLGARRLLVRGRRKLALVRAWMMDTVALDQVRSRP